MVDSLPEGEAKRIAADALSHQRALVETQKLHADAKRKIAMALAGEIEEAPPTLLNPRPDIRKVRRIVQTLNTNAEGKISTREAKVLFSKLLGVRFESISDDHPEANTSPRVCTRCTPHASSHLGSSHGVVLTGACLYESSHGRDD